MSKIVDPSEGDDGPNLNVDPSEGDIAGGSGAHHGHEGHGEHGHGEHGEHGEHGDDKPGGGHKEPASGRGINPAQHSE